MRIGAWSLPDRKGEFVVWAPSVTSLTLDIVGSWARCLVMTPQAGGYWSVVADDVAPGARYRYLLDSDRQRPDPASFFQPEGVHGPSQLVDHGAFVWNDAGWTGIALEAMIIYEVHIGTFTPEGTCEAMIARLDDLVRLGINAVELMPVAQFPGERNWGYDGAHPFAVQNSYGGPQGLKLLVDAAHERGMAVILDVVYNHLGPEGNYLAEYAPFFTDKYTTPWGKALNFDDAGCEGVREYFVQNALYWLREYHVDALRLDAVHGIFDESSPHILQEIAAQVDVFSRESGRPRYVIAESDLNDARLIRERAAGGYGLHAQWSDDFHHSVHAVLTPERGGYYADFGSLAHWEKALREGFVYSGQYSAFRKRPHGTPAADVPASKFVVCLQNHDQVGNRMMGERLSSLVNFEALKLAAGALLVSPYIPLLFMGEEYGENAPFLYFVSHSDEQLIRAVREGRNREFRSFRWEQEPPDPQSEATFQASRLCWEKRSLEKGRCLTNFYAALIALRKTNPVLRRLDNKHLEITVDEPTQVVRLRRWIASDELVCVMNFDDREATASVDIRDGVWNTLIDSADPQWLGPGALFPARLSGGTQRCRLRPHGFILLSKENTQ